MARCPFAIWRGANARDYSSSAITPNLVVIHVAQGSAQSGIDAWFHNPNSIVSAHFSVGANGILEQYVDTHQEAYAEMAYNGRAISIEHTGYSGDHLTDAQLATDARLFEWIKKTHRIPFTWRIDAFHGAGYVGHGELGLAGGNHLDCPGVPIKDDVRNLLNKMHRPLFSISMSRR